jgi:hypothetical protein
MLPIHVRREKPRLPKHLQDYLPSPTPTWLQTISASVASLSCMPEARQALPLETVLFVLDRAVPQPEYDLQDAQDTQVCENVAHALAELAREDSLRLPIARAWLDRLEDWGTNEHASKPLRMHTADALSRVVKSEPASMVVVGKLGAEGIVRIADVADLDIQGKVERVLENIGGRPRTEATRRVRIVTDDFRVV